jgi:hypothetical protein
MCFALSGIYQVPTDHGQQGPSFNVHGSIHHNNIPIYIRQDAKLHSLFYLETALHVLCGAITHHQEHIQLYLQHLVFHTVTAICRYRERVGTGLSVLWVAYATHSTLNPVPTFPQ